MCRQEGAGEQACWQWCQVGCGVLLLRVLYCNNSIQLLAELEVVSGCTVCDEREEGAGEWCSGAR